MSDYSKITNFLSKDSLALNDPAKYVKGSEIDAEFNAIAVAVATKADTASPTLTTPNIGTPSAGVLTNCTGLPVAGGGTGRATSTTAYGLIAAGTTATGAHQTLAAGTTAQILVGGGASALPVWTSATGSGSPVRSTSPTLVTPVLGVATATSVNGVVMTITSAGASAASLGLGSGALALTDVLSNNNTAIGESALSTNAQHYNNVALGNYAGKVIDGTNNTFIGFNSGAGGSERTANNNTAIGVEAGYSVQGSNNTYLGYSAGGAHTTGSNSTVIGYNSAASSVSASNEFTLGNSSIATLRCQVTSITALSDARDKTDVAPLPSGLDTVMALNPVRFTWNMRDGGKVGIKDSGFIAQDLQTVDDEWLRLVYAENPEKLEATYGRLIPVLVKAIQELKAEINQLKGVSP